MPLIGINQQTFASESDETVLQCLERNNCAPPSSCRSGMCHTCMMRSVGGPPPSNSQVGLKDSLRHQNYFLSCICVPNDDMEVGYADAAASPSISIILVEKTLLSPSIMRLRFTTDQAYEYKAGQFANLFKDECLTRSYSIASVPDIDNYLEFHIEKIPNGKMSGWIFDEFPVGTELKVSEPLGECYYSDGGEENNMLLIATGSGLAPVYGVLRDAINRGHKGEIHLYHGASDRDKLYLIDELSMIAKKYKNVYYTPSLSKNVNKNIEQGRASELALSNHKDLKNWQIYLCGHPEMVSSTKRKAFLAGAALNDIHADPFEFAK